MPVSPDCILCLCRQSLDAARFVSDDPMIHEKVLRRSLQLALDRGFLDTPPLLGQEIHRDIRELTQNSDPYQSVKKLFNDLVYSQINTLKSRILTSPNPIEAALRIAIGGNAIDFALGATNLTPEFALTAIDKALAQPITGNAEKFLEILPKAKKILYLLDNCGEIVCDRLFIEEIKRQYSSEITAVVRGFPVINDATILDAQDVGLTDVCSVITNGNDGLGTILEKCSEEFHERLKEADLVIAKGLANYETLIEYGPDKFPNTVAYLFKSKCAFIAKLSSSTLGDLVVQFVERQ